MTDEGDFVTFVERIKAVAGDVNALILDAYLEISDKAGAPQVALDLDEFVSVIRHTKPRLICLIESVFELESEIAELIETAEGNEDDDDRADANSVALRSIVRKWNKYEGKPCLVLAATLADGIILTSVLSPPWREEFDAELEAVEQLISENHEEERLALNKRDSAEVREKAAILADHPSFNAGRTSFEKRAFLAEQLFPNLDPELLQAITRRAENIDWLNKSAFKP